MKYRLRSIQFLNANFVAKRLHALLLGQRSPLLGENAN
jgi:hypothetical protein